MKTLKVMCRLALIVATTALLVTGLPLRSSDTDGRIVSSARASYILPNVPQGRRHPNRIQRRRRHSDRHGRPRIAQIHGARDRGGPPRGHERGQQAGAERRRRSLELRSLRITDKVRTTLRFHRSVNGINPEVDVKDGNVTLRGVASSRSARELATQYAKDVDGVRDVDNQMTVSPAPSRNGEDRHRENG